MTQPSRTRRILKWVGLGVSLLLFVPYITSSPHTNILLPFHIMIVMFSVLLWLIDGRTRRRLRAKRIGLIVSTLILIVWLASAPSVVQYVGKNQSVTLGHGCLEYVAIRSDQATSQQLQYAITHALRRCGPAKPGGSYRYYPIAPAILVNGWGVVWYGLGLESPRIDNEIDAFWGFLNNDYNNRFWCDRTGFLIPLWFVFAMIAIPTAYLYYRDFKAIPPGHCQQCGYNLRYNTSGICPECGTAILEETREKLKGEARL